MWRGLVVTLLDLCRFRRGPEDLPYAPPLLFALLIASAALQAWFNLVAGAGWRGVVAVWFGGLAVLGALHLMLRVRGRPERFVQATTAMLGVYVLFGIVADALAATLPLAALRTEILAHPEQPPTLSGRETLILMGFFVLLVWQFCVWVRVLRRAFEVPLGGAVLVFLLLLLVNWIVAGFVAAMIGVT